MDKTGTAEAEKERKTFRITLPDGQWFPCWSDESVLEAMRRSGPGPVSYGCFGGGCGVCAMRVVRGSYRRFHPMSRAHVTAEDEQKGIALLCCIKPLSDLALDYRESIKDK